jgi:transglutaminase-like putative cysteine protease
MIAGLRALGLPARYVSGYIRTYPPAGDEERRGGDASHAWAAAWCGPALGWIEFDPTNDLVVNEEHIVLAYGRDFSDVSPLRGVILGGGAHTAEVSVTVTALG